MLCFASPDSVSIFLRRVIAWLLGVGAAFATLVGAFAVVDAAGGLSALLFLTAVWGAVQAAAFSLTLPPTQRGEGAG